jgi:hypothetical protein
MAKLKLGSTVGGQEIAIGSDITTLYDRIGTAETNISNNDTDIATLDTRVDGNDSEINQIDSNHDGIVDNADNVTSTYKGNDIDTDGDGKVDNADRLNGKSWVTIASGSEYDYGYDLFTANLKPGGTHTHYNISVFNNERDMIRGEDFRLINAQSPYSNALSVDGYSSGGTIYYEVWSWE